MLNTLSQGSPTGQPPLLIVHGLFGSARNWGVIQKRLSDAREVFAVDQRNHGDSPWQDSQSYFDMAEDIAKVIEANGGKMDVLGHSMGGKAVMVLALTRPDLVNRLIVADVAPIAYQHSQDSLIQAMKGLDLDGLTLRSEANRRLSQTVGSEAVRAFLLQSLDLKSTPPHWKLNLDVLEAEMGKIVGFPELSGAFTGETLFVYGGASDYVQPGYQPTIDRLFPHNTMAKIDGVGHWLHAEKPREFEQIVRDFIA
ncbi:alpha/beta fold hydrolase [Thioclava litoralis]|uniref:Alpha/beta fold hydrolase n=1 Tax=Thioclava litoralis TaxID=3076557 RepID=A0ABZ1E3S3_9RHOB|nr:alpha/beta fold hydrolase [Thioclava sp. FTW29]